MIVVSNRSSLAGIGGCVVFVFETFDEGGGVCVSFVVVGAMAGGDAGGVGAFVTAAGVSKTVSLNKTFSFAGVMRRVMRHVSDASGNRIQDSSDVTFGYVV